MKKNKNLVLQLIKDDLINTQFINGLNAIGLDAGNYYLHISESFFVLMGFGNYDEDTKLYDEYFYFAEKTAPANLFKNPKQLHKTALEVYNNLMVEKEKKN